MGGKGTKRRTFLLAGHFPSQTHNTVSVRREASATHREAASEILPLALEILSLASKILSLASKILLIPQVLQLVYFQPPVF